jgi:hypothetical protein
MTDIDDKLMKELISAHKPKDIAKYLNIATGTVKRWIELEKIPISYQFDIMKMLSKEIDYSKYSSKEKDQFFTPVETAKLCFEVFCNKLKELDIDEKQFFYIEPSAGDGSFLKVLPSERSIGLDIEPKGDNIIKQDFLNWKPENVNKNYVVFGNPPFGLRGNLALRFINHSSSFNSQFVCFILPQLFESDGKGSPMKRITEYNLIHSQIINPIFYEPTEDDKIKNMKVNVVFQIWSKNIVDEKYSISNLSNDELKIYSLSNGGTSSSTRNKKMLDKCHLYLPSTCFGEENMKCYDSFYDLPNQRGYGLVFNSNKNVFIEKCKNIDWSKVCFLSTNSALNLRSSKISKILFE